jgi:glucose/mannose transport system substrate-binding protein
MKQLKLWTVGAFAFGLLGCGAEADKDEDVEVEKTTIELFSWWSQPGEAEALQELMSLHQDEFPNEDILNAAEVATNGGVDAKMELAKRLAEGNPPDLFQQNAFEVLNSLALGTGKYQQLDDLFEAQGLKEVMVPEVLENVTFEGHQYAVPVNIHRENSLFFNKKLFDQHDIEPPTTIEELLAACEKLKAAGITPFAVSPQSWILGKMFEGLAQGAMTPQGFVNYYTRSGPVDEVALAKAVDLYVKIIEDYSNIEEIDEAFGWTQASDAVHSGDVAMFLHGDWVKGYLMSRHGATPNVDFGVVGAPGAGDLFVYGVDVFVMPEGAKNREGALDFLTTIASPAGQAAFNTIKGSSPMRLDVDQTKIDAVAAEQVQSFKAAKMRVALHGSPALSDAIGWFTYMTPDHAEIFRNRDMLL